MSTAIDHYIMVSTEIEHYIKVSAEIDSVVRRFLVIRYFTIKNLFVFKTVQVSIESFDTLS